MSEQENPQRDGAGLFKIARHGDNEVEIGLDIALNKDVPANKPIKVLVNLRPHDALLMAYRIIRLADEILQANKELN